MVPTWLNTDNKGVFPSSQGLAAGFLGEVEHWSARARRAASNASYGVAAEITVPALLPSAW